MICPACSSTNLYCIDSREMRGNKRRRRHKCLDCDCRFTTVEIIVDTETLKDKALDDIKETIRLANMAKIFADKVKGEKNE
jgi:transcriptional regulator NrdR family protein